MSTELAKTTKSPRRASRRTSKTTRARSPRCCRARCQQTACSRSCCRPRCARRSFWNAARSASCSLPHGQLGLEAGSPLHTPTRVPFFNRTRTAPTCQLIVGYRGLIDLGVGRRNREHRSALRLQERRVHAALRLNPQLIMSLPSMMTPASCAWSTRDRAHPRQQAPGRSDDAAAGRAHRRPVSPGSVGPLLTAQDRPPRPPVGA